MRVLSSLFLISSIFTIVGCGQSDIPVRKFHQDEVLEKNLEPAGDGDQDPFRFGEPDEDRQSSVVVVEGKRFPSSTNEVDWMNSIEGIDHPFQLHDISSDKSCKNRNHNLTIDKLNEYIKLLERGKESASKIRKIERNLSVYRKYDLLYKDIPVKNRSSSELKAQIVKAEKDLKKLASKKIHHRLSVEDEKLVEDFLKRNCAAVDIYRKKGMIVNEKTGKKKWGWYSRANTRQRYMTKEVLPMVHYRHLPTRFLRQLELTSIANKKKYFSCLIAPQIIYVNESIKKERRFVESLELNGNISQEEQVELLRLVKNYFKKGSVYRDLERKDGELDFDTKKIIISFAKEKTVYNGLSSLQREKFIDALLNRVNVIPLSLAMAQAAAESGWGGASDGGYAAREAYSLFGQHLIPYSTGNDKDAREACGEKGVWVKRFPTTLRAIQSYMNMLNSGYSYEELRKIRKKNRNADLAPNSYDMVAGLTSYAADPKPYFNKLRNLICLNQWQVLDNYKIENFNGALQVSFLGPRKDHYCNKD